MIPPSIMRLSIVFVIIESAVQYSKHYIWPIFGNANFFVALLAKFSDQYHHIALPCMIIVQQLFQSRSSSSVYSATRDSTNNWAYIPGKRVPMRLQLGVGECQAMTWWKAEESLVSDIADDGAGAIQPRDNVFQRHARILSYVVEVFQPTCAVIWILFISNVNRY